MVLYKHTAKLKEFPHSTVQPFNTSPCWTYVALLFSTVLSVSISVEVCSSRNTWYAPLQDKRGSKNKARKVCRSQGEHCGQKMMDFEFFLKTQVKDESAEVAKRQSTQVSLRGYN